MHICLGKLDVFILQDFKCSNLIRIKIKISYHKNLATYFIFHIVR
jgi:hypothetical protein